MVQLRTPRGGGFRCTLHTMEGEVDTMRATAPREILHLHPSRLAINFALSSFYEAHSLTSSTAPSTLLSPISTAAGLAGSPTRASESYRSYRQWRRGTCIGEAGHHFLAQQRFLASHRHRGDGNRWKLRIPCCGSCHTQSRMRVCYQLYYPAACDPKGQAAA